MGRASRTKQDLDHRARIAAQRAAARRTQVRNRLLVAGGAVVAVIAVAIALVLVATRPHASAKPPAADGPTGTALAGVVNQLTTVPGSVLDQVGGGSLGTADIGSANAVGGGYLTPVTGSRLVSGGKPEVLYVGADFCPYCAAIRWPLIVALSRFGTFSGLTTTRSATANGSGQAEPYPATPTWTFSGATYASPYLSFAGVETNSNVPDPATGGYTVLGTPTADQQALMTRYDTSQGIPFVDIGNAYVQLSVLVPYSPQDLQGMSWSQVAAAVANPASAVGAKIDASANYLTAAMCQLTGGKPATACTPAIRALQPQLSGK